MLTDHGIAVRTHCKVFNGDPILTVGRAAVFELDAGPRAWRWWVVRSLVVLDRVRHAADARIGITHGNLSDVPRRSNVLFEKRGRNAQGVRDVVETLHLDVLRQNFLRVHVHAYQSFYR